MSDEDGRAGDEGVEESDGIGGEIGDMIGGLAAGASMAAMVRGEDVPAGEERGQERLEITPAAGDAVEEDKGRAVGRADGAMEAAVAELEALFLHPLHDRWIAGRRGRDNSFLP
jgi:hypothetical protein